MLSQGQSTEEYYLCRITALEKKCQELEVLNQEMFSYIHQLADMQSARNPPPKHSLEQMWWRMANVNQHGYVRRYCSHLQAVLSTALEGSPHQAGGQDQTFEFASSEYVPSDVRIQMKALEKELLGFASDLRKMKQRRQKLQEEQNLRDHRSTRIPSDHLKLKEEYLSFMIKQTSVQYLSLLSKLQVESAPKFLAEAASGLDLRGITSRPVLEAFFEEFDSSTSHAYFMVFNKLAALSHSSPVSSVQEIESSPSGARSDYNTSYKDEILGRVIQQLNLDDKIAEICAGVKEFFSALLRQIKVHERIRLTYAVQADIVRLLSGSTEQHLKSIESNLARSFGQSQVNRGCRRFPSLRVVALVIMALKRMERLSVVNGRGASLLTSPSPSRKYSDKSDSETLVKCLLALKDARPLSGDRRGQGVFNDMVRDTCYKCFAQVSCSQEAATLDLTRLNASPISARSSLMLRGASSPESCLLRAFRLEEATRTLSAESGRLEDYLPQFESSAVEEGMEVRMQQQEALISLLQEKLQRVEVELEDSVPRATFMKMKQKHIKLNRFASTEEDFIGSSSRKPNSDVEKRIEEQTEQLAAAQDSIRRQEEEIRKLQDLLIAKELQAGRTPPPAASASGGSSGGSERVISIEEELASAEEELESCRMQISQVLKGKRNR